MATVTGPAAKIEQRLLARNAVAESFFAGESHRLAEKCREMSERFLLGGRLLAFGRGPYATDAQHVAVEFVHPVIVGKRALPALDLSASFSASLSTLLEKNDMVLGLGPPEGDAEVWEALDQAHRRGAMTFALPGAAGSYFISAASPDPFIHQEIVETLYHTLWETVHVFFERRQLGHDAGQSGFLYPFLGSGNNSDSTETVREVAQSIRMKAADDAQLRTRAAEEESGKIASAALAICDRLSRGGKLLVFGNGGSATDANDFTMDCTIPPPGLRPIPAISLSADPANLSAIANDVGIELIFQRQLIALAGPHDIAIAISTSGGSKNIHVALEEARKRGLLTIALLGYDGGEVLRRGLADFPLIVRSDYIPRIQEVQASIYHVLREQIDEAIHA